MLLFYESCGQVRTPSQPFPPKLNAPEPQLGTLLLRTRVRAERTASEMVAGHVLLAAGTLPGVRRPAGGRGAWARGVARQGRWRGAGSAIDTPAPGRASAPPGRRGRISARKACCAGTQNTAHTVMARPAPPRSPPHAAPIPEPQGASARVSRAWGHVPNREARDVLSNPPPAASTHQFPSPLPAPIGWLVSGR